MAFLQCRSILMSSLFRPVNHKHDTCVTKKVIWPNVAILGDLQWLNPIKHFLSSRHTNPKLLCLWALWVGQNLWLPLKHSLVALTKPVVLQNYWSKILLIKWTSSKIWRKKCRKDDCTFWPRYISTIQRPFSIRLHNIWPNVACNC